jgi:hypothetical protein
MPTTITHPKKKTDRLNDIQAQIVKLQEELHALRGAEPPTLILRELHDKKTGRIDAQKVADFIAVPLKRLAEGLGLNYKAVHRDPSGVSFQEALQPVKRALEYLSQAFKNDPATIRAWLNTSHPMLDGKTSLEMILQGKAFAVDRLLGNAWDAVVS